MVRQDRGNWVKYTLLGIVTLLIICILVLASVPPVSRDALTHHLYIPKLWLQNGSIDPLPSMIFSYYPMNLELLYTLSLYFGNDIVPKFIHLAFGCGTAWCIFYYLKKRLGRFWGLFGSLFFLSTPIIIHLETTVYVDLGVIFFTTSSMLLLIRWRERQELRILLLAGVCCGLAAGTKYNGLIVLFLLSCFAPFLTRGSSEKSNDISPAFAGLIFLSCSVLVFSPWLIRNFLWTANPVYPLFDSIFNNNKASLSQGMNPLLIRKLIYHESLWQMVLIPLRIFFEGQDNNPQYFDGVLNPFILIFSLASFLPNVKLAKYKTDRKFFMWFILLFFLFAFVQRVIRIRYIVPVLPCLIILSVFGIYNLYQYFKSVRSDKLSFVITGALVVCALAININYLAHYWQKIRPLDYLSGKEDRTAFISRFWPEYPLIEYANTQLSDSAKILAVFMGNRGYYFDHDVSFDLKNGKSRICTIVQSRRAEDIYTTLKNDDFTHLFVRRDLFTHFAANELSNEEKQNLQYFFDHNTKQIAFVGNFSLLALLP